MSKKDKPADLIKEAFEEKTWNEIHTTDSWRVFKIISEIVEGFEKLVQNRSVCVNFWIGKNSSE